TNILPNPTQNPTNPTGTQVYMEDMEAQSEKKRRRDEEQADDKVELKDSEHFLTACPGSQACRDQ
ncbi:hypothetical protein A2U01_0100213, partial [Trifolium medium]|nr:hypothetical protein [Trifolium medium]